MQGPCRQLQARGVRSAGECSMRKLFCRILGHDYMETSARRRECIRCGQHETLRQMGELLAWVEVTPAVAGRRA